MEVKSLVFRFKIFFDKIPVRFKSPFDKTLTKNFKKIKKPDKINNIARQDFLINEKGIAMVEMLPLLAIFILLFGLLFGFWSSIHSGILHSISARRYAFEVLNNRTHFIYHRDTIPPVGDKSYYEKDGKRFFAVVEFQGGGEPDKKSENKEFNLFNEAGLRITGKAPCKAKNEEGDCVIKIKSGYGICIDFDCGD